MHQREEVILARDIGAIQIPDGNTVMLAEGTPLLITQQLGGSFTVMSDRGAMYRVDDRNADALGKEATADAQSTVAGSLDDQVWAELRKCYDPEIPVNIVDLGLVYDCRLGEGEGDVEVDIKMTLTAPGCGMGPVLAEDVTRRVNGLDGIQEARVELVFDPPWNQNMMSEAARLQLGFM